MPTISVVIATYNRADAILRAVKSVQAQTFTDWELIVVDDGSTDNTAALIEGIEPKMRLIRQKNKGFVEARNTALRATTGEFVAFLDDDDEYFPFHLELGVAFLRAHPEAPFVGSELKEDFGHGRHLIHYRVETSHRYPLMASRIGSHALDLPPGETDDYRRVYASKQQIGEWGRGILARAGITSPAYHYSGNLFPHLRWGYLMAVNSLIVRRKELEAVGFQNTAYRLAADYHLIGVLCKRSHANFLGVPTYIKHELNMSGNVLASSHIVTGTRAFRCVQDELRAFEDFFWKADPENPELCAIRAGKYYYAGMIAVSSGERTVALEWFRIAQAGRHVRLKAAAMTLFLRVVPSSETSRKIFLTGKRIYDACTEIRSGHLSVGALLWKIFENLLESY